MAKSIMNSNSHTDGTGGGCKPTDIICTIDSGIAMWHTLILEETIDEQPIDRNAEKEQ